MSNKLCKKDHNVVTTGPKVSAVLNAEQNQSQPFLPESIGFFMAISEHSNGL